MLDDSFKRRENIMRKLANEYQKSKIIELKGLDLLYDNVIGETISTYMDTKRKYRYYYSLQTRIDYVLEKLEWEYSDFLKREFFSANYRNNWWQFYYSRSTYYRIKSKAMNKFLGMIYA